MNQGLTRRQFLKLAGLATGTLALRPLPPDSGASAFALGRVAATWIGLYREPSFSSVRLSTLLRDELVNLLAREVSDDGPAHNPLWYRVADGYVHSGYLQIVRWQPQTPQTQIPDGGSLFEVSVPFTRSYREGTRPPIRSIGCTTSPQPGSTSRSSEPMDTCGIACWTTCCGSTTTCAPNICAVSRRRS